MVRGHEPGLLARVARGQGTGRPRLLDKGTLEKGMERMGPSLKRSFWPIDGRVQCPPPASNPAIA